MNREPRDYQRRIINKTVGYYNSGFESVLIESPIGSGKTSMGLEATIPFAQEGKTIGWAAMRRNLLTQAQAEAHKIGYPFKIHSISMFDKRPPKVDFLVVDEAHHDATQSMATVHGVIKPRWVLGLSATPQRTDRVGLNFQHTVRDAGIGELINDGYLSQYKHFTIPEYTPTAIADTYHRQPDRWGKSLMFFRTYDECLECAERLNHLGWGSQTDIITGKTDREAQLAWFDSGKTRIVINMMVLTEGFDSPSLQTVFVRDSSRNPTIQMGGRVFRKFPGIRFKNLIQSKNTRWPFTKTATCLEQLVWKNGNWRHVSGESLDTDSLVENQRDLLIRVLQEAYDDGTSWIRVMGNRKKKAEVWVDPSDLITPPAEERREEPTSDFDVSGDWEE